MSVGYAAGSAVFPALAGCFSCTDLCRRGAGLARRAAFCSIFTADERLFTADERLFMADERFFMAGKAVFQGLKIRQSRLEERLTAFLKDVKDTHLTSRASAGKTVSVSAVTSCMQS